MTCCWPVRLSNEYKRGGQPVPAVPFFFCGCLDFFLFYSSNLLFPFFLFQTEKKKKKLSIWVRKQFIFQQMKYRKREHSNSPDFSLLTTKGNQNLTKQQHEIIIKWLLLFLFLNFVWAVQNNNGHSYIWLMWGVILLYISFFNLLHKCVILYNSWKWIYTT